eukprot:gene7512-5400_t
MPPKKDDKKKGKDAGASAVLREIDLAHYVRKPVAIPESNPKQQKIYQPFKGKLATVDQALPLWPETLQENWAEAIPLEGGPEIKYPSYLQFDKHIPAATYFGLDAGEPTDPKAKGKKEAKKPPAKGKEEVLADVVETLVNENGVPMPVIYQAQADEWAAYPPLQLSADNALPGVDGVLGEVFAMIARFAPNLAELVSAEGSAAVPSCEQLHQNYLWRAVYPQLAATQKPVYNALGRHVVKLHVAGAWRKVVVSDSVPVRSDGRCCLATTAQRLELWPILLSKALYTAYAALGYKFLDDAALPLHEKKNLLFTFAAQALTGWNPHQQRLHWPQMLATQPSKSTELLMLMLHNGVPLIREADVVAEDDCFRFNLPSGGDGDGDASAERKDAAGDDVDEAADEADALKTKRRFKEEYQARKATRDDIVRRILERERRVDAVDEAVRAARPSEVFFVVRQRLDASDDAAADAARPGTSAAAILGIVLPGDRTPLQAADLRDVRLLLRWRRSPRVDVTPNTTDAVVLGRGRFAVAEFAQPFPQASPVDYAWCSLGALADAAGDAAEALHLVSLFTGTATRHQAAWSRRWQPYAPPAPAGGEAAAKDAKGKAAGAKGGGKKDAAAEAPLVDGLFAEPPAPPPTFLRIDVAALRSPAAATAAAIATELSTEEQRELAEALALQQAALPPGAATEPPQPTTMATEARGVDLTVTLAADITEIVTLPPALQPSEGEAPPAAVLGEPLAVSDEAAHNYATDAAEAEAAAAARLLPSDTLLVLQEVQLARGQRFGAAPARVPRVYVMKLAAGAALPQATQFVHFAPTEEDGDAVFFWLRLFTRASVAVRFDCNVGVAVDLAETLWTQQAAQGYEALVEHGDCGATVAGVDQPLLRLPLFSVADDAAAGDAGDGGDGDEAALEPAMVFLHVTDPGVAPHVDLSYGRLEPAAVSVTGHGAAADGAQFPAVQGVLAPFARVSPAAATAGGAVLPPCPVLLATLRNTPDGFHQRSFLRAAPSTASLASAATPAPPAAELPPFGWKLVVLSRRRLAPVADAFARHPNQRARLQEAPALRLFRDVVTLDRGSFPLSLKLSLAALPPPPAAPREDGDDADPDDDEAPAFALRLYRRHDEALLAEHSGRDVVEVAWQDAGLLDDPAHPPPAPATPAPAAAPAGKAAKAAPPAKGGKGGAAPAAEAADAATGPPVELLVECVLLLPPPDRDPFGYDAAYRRFFSRYPHVFDAFFGGAPGAAAEAAAAAPGDDDAAAAAGAALQRETAALQAALLRPTPIHEHRPLTASFRTLPGHVYAPPAAPLLHWRLDWQAGRVLAAAHDTAQLLRFQTLKQSWDALPELFTADGAGRSLNSGGGGGGASRYERAQAALQFLRASAPGGDAAAALPASASAKSLPPSRPATASAAAQAPSSSSSSSLSQATLEQLAAALAAPGGVEEMQRRYAAVLAAAPSPAAALGDAEVVEAAQLRAVASLVAPNRSGDDDAALGSDAWRALVAQRRRDDAAAREAHFDALRRCAEERLPVAAFQQHVAARVAAVAQRLQAQRAQQAALWDAREQVRADYEAKNQALYALLRRARDAKAAAAANEAAAEAERLKNEAKNAKGKKK